MAAVSEVFTLGSTVWCRTCYNAEMEGEVMAFEPQNKILVLKCPSSNADPKLNDVQFLNLSLVSELRVKKEASNYQELPQSLNLQRLNTRARNHVEEKKRMFQAISANVSTEGQGLFIALSRQFKEVRWRNSDIVVWNQEVIISPPYQLENIQGNANSKGYEYIYKVVSWELKKWGGKTSSGSGSQPLIAIATQLTPGVKFKSVGHGKTYIFDFVIQAEIY